MAKSPLVVTSPVAERRIARANQWLADRPADDEVLIVAANRHAADDLVRKFAAARGSIFGWHRLSLSQLAITIAEPLLASKGLVPLSRLGMAAMTARAVHSVGRGGELGIYEPIADTPGFPRASASVLAELRLAGIAPDTLGKYRLDLANVLRSYEAELAGAGLTDWPGVLAIAVEAVAQGLSGPSRFIGLPILLLDVAIASDAEGLFVRSLATVAPECLATVPAGDGRTLDRLRSLPRCRIEAIEEKRPAADDALRRLQSGLFDKTVPMSSGRVGDAAVEVFSAPGEGRECIEIVRRALHLANEGMPFDRMAILLRSPQNYGAHLDEALARADIPAHVAGRAMRPDPSGRAFCILLRCAAEGLSARRFAEYLSLGQVPDATPAGLPPDALPPEDRWTVADHDLMPLSLVGAELRENPEREPGESALEPVVSHGQLRAPRRWERLLVEAAVIGGRERWRRRLDGLANAYRAQLSQLGDDEARSVVTQRSLDDLSAFAGFALPLIDDLDGLPNVADWEVWLQRLGALATRAIRRPDRILSVLTELAPMNPVGPVPLAEVVSVLEDLLLEVAAPSSEPPYGRIFIAPVEAARGLHFDAVFVPGLAEKLFPQRIVEEPLLLDGIRGKLPGSMETNQSRLESERLALAIAVGAAEKRIVFSYPRLDLDQGRPRVPSFYALETVRAAEGRLLDFAELARRAGSAATARLGWPAPSSPSDAIDDAEHDLAVLAGIWEGSEKRLGAARYLVGSNPHLARALRTRYQRWSGRWTPADGLVGQPGSVKSLMALHGLNARGYSPTALQTYAACPYKFFLRAVHRLAPRDVAEEIEQLDPLQRGSLIHDCQFELFKSLQDRKLLPVRPPDMAAASALLDEIVATNAARCRDDLAPAIARVWEDELAAIHADLREWLRRAGEDSSGFVPLHFELSFGIDVRGDREVDPASATETADLACGIKLRVSIDLVERHPSGLMRVTDHKTGRADAKKGQTVAGGTSLQPLLYALAVEKLFAGQDEVTEGRLYFCTSRGGFAEHAVTLDPRSRKVAQTIATTIGSALDDGGFPAAPAPGECDRCDYRCVCGPHEDVRVARKPKPALQGLVDLRTLP